MAPKRARPKTDSAEPAPTPKRPRGTARASKGAEITSIRPSLGESNTEIKPRGQIYKAQAASSISDESPASKDTKPSSSDEGLITDLRNYINGSPTLGAVYKTPVPPSVVPEAPADDDDDKETSAKEYHTNLDPARAPMSDHDAIYDDMAANLIGTGFYEAIKLLENQHVRLFTMCSGTEAPVIAIRKLKAALERRGIKKFEIYHVGSAEIEPFKQAYIQTNFAPPHIFRDVTDFHEENMNQAHPLTVYGAPEAPPKNVDILVAGSACVDYSNLNVSPKNFKEDGESWITMKGIAHYAKKHRPVIVIIENVAGAPWKDIVTYWETLQYVCHVVKVDSKNFYLPQTRQRGYMLAIDRELADKVGFDHKNKFNDFETNLTALARRASSPYTNFTYFPDDPRFEIIMQDIMSTASGRKGNSNWETCLLRYNQHRSQLDLGFSRAVTFWQNNGSSRPPDYFAMRALMQKKCERILDTLDIVMLRCLVERHYDIFYKNRVLDVSQNVDRERDTKHFGIIPCVTPDGQLFDTLRGGMLSGKELLALQGIPVDELTFTTETSKQLTDLAGNAMTAPVVCAVIAAAFSVTSFKREGGTDLKSLFPAIGRDKSVLPQALLTHLPHEQVIETWEAKQLQFAQLDLGRKDDATLKVIKASASQSRQLCLCEGYLGLQINVQFSICKGCGHTVCGTCKGNPEHEYTDLPVENRLCPSEFINFIQQNLPRSMTLDCEVNDVSLASLQPFDDEHANQKYQQLVSTAAASTYHYSKIKRGRVWKVEYVAPAGRLELRIFPTLQASDLSRLDPLDDEAVECQWSLFANCDEREESESPMRTLLQNPVARMHPNEGILQGQWQVWHPQPLVTDLTVSGSGELRESLESRIGITNKLWKGRKEFSAIEIGGFGPLQTQILEFVLLPKCAAPHGSIYRSVDPHQGQVLYFLLHSNPFQPADQDSYVVTTDPHRRNNHDHRPVVFAFPRGWRMNIEDGKLRDTSVSCQYLDLWLESETMAISSDHGFARTWLSTELPATAESLKWCEGIEQPSFGIEIPVSKQLRRAFPPDTVFEVDLAAQSGKLHHLEWLLTQVANTSQPSDRWQSLGKWDVAEQQCSCCPSPPELTWYWVWLNGKCKKKVIKPFEDPAAASDFEKKLKSRPSPAKAIVRCYETRVFVEVQFNPQTLAHRSAIAFRASAEDEGVRTEWRVVRYNPLDKLRAFEPTALLSNEKDPVWNYDLPKFARELWKEQEQLLTWARSREMGLPGWEEVYQSDLPIAPLNLSLEGRAVRPHAIRGGVIADDVGAGKTTSALALIATDANEPQTQSAPTIQSSRMYSAATLILVPKDIMTQCKGQIDTCFLKGSKLVVEIKTVNDLIKLELKDLVGEIIILAAWDLFDNVKYWECLRVLSYSPNVPFSGGRAFEQWMHLALDNLGKMFEEYEEDSADKDEFWAQRETGKKRLNQFHHFPAYRSKQADKRSYTANKLPEGPAKNAMEKSHKFKPKPVEATSADDKLDAAYEQQMELWPRTAGSKADPAIRKIYALLHAFNFRRLIIDEFQYLRDLSLHGVMTLSARSRWLLSATPPTNTLEGVNTMARLLGTFITHDEIRPEHLGADLKSCASVQSRSHVEDFLRHLTAPSLSGIEAEYGQANRFLNEFVRHNELILNNSRRRDKYVIFKPSALDYATFLEFFQVVLSTSIVFGKQNPPDATVTARSGRINKWVQYSTNALHALICCTSYMRNDNHAADCMAILEAQRKTFGRVGTKLLQNFRETFWFDRQQELSNAMKASGKTEENEQWRKFVHSIAAGDYEDPVVTDFVNKLLKVASNDAKKPEDLAINDRERQLRKSRSKPNDQELIEEKDWQKKGRKKEMSWRNKLMTGQVLRLIKAARAVRFFDTVSKIASGSEEAKCGRCGVSKHTELADLFLLATCGHSVCRSCLAAQAKVRDDQCPLDGCKVLVNGRLQMDGTRFGTDETVPHHEYGSRMDAVVATINTALAKPGENQVLLFVQFDQMKEHLIDALKAAQITFTDGTKDAGKEVEAFKTNPNCRVLLLKIDTADAAGWNLHMVNHVMLVAPFLTSTQHAYDSIMKQAVGRALRFGNDSPFVDVYHFAMARTCEVNILENRTGKILVRRGAKSRLVDKALAGDVLLKGPSLDTYEIAGAEGDDDDGEEAEEGEDGEGTA